MTESDVTVPPRSSRPPGGRTLDLVWWNEVADPTFAVGEAAGRCFIKWAPAGSGLDLSAEADRMTWALRYHPVPRPLAQGHDDEGAWLGTLASSARTRSAR